MSLRPLAFVNSLSGFQMKSLCVIVLMAMNVIIAFGQNTFKAFIKDTDSKERLVGATAVIEGTKSGASADENGYVEIKNVSSGQRTIVFNLVGYEQHIEQFLFPLRPDTLIEVLLHRSEEELEEVIISTTRSSRTIADEPTRMEAITGEELGEKANMKPGDIRMLLTESTGIQTQQTSATTASASIRIQGLDGRYTQILKDGYPLYAGFAAGLSIMQIPPLDLQQVEVIKGSASTLYGGGAIAGLVNLISKTPSNARDLSFLVNGTSAGGLDLNGFYSERFERVGISMFASRNSNAAYDPADIDLTAIPEFERYTLNPRLFFYFNEQSTLNIGVNTSFENRLGGDIHYIRDEGDSVHSYFERNKSTRISTQVGFDHKLTKRSSFAFKNSIGSFTRLLEIPEYIFDGKQLSTFSEAAFTFGNEQLEWIAGVNLWTDTFTEEKQLNVVPRDYAQIIMGGFVQNVWDANEWLKVETGMRLDYAKDYGMFVLPRISALLTIAPSLTSRIGGGLGYKLPTIFTEEAEAIQFREVLPIDAANTSAERSVGGNADVNFRTSIFEAISFSINQMVFYTKLDKPLTMTPANQNLQFVNANGHIDTKGLETNIKINYGNLKLLLGYTLTDTKQHYNGTLSDLPLTPKHRVNTVLMYEVHEAWRVGAEAYYFDSQRLNDGSRGVSYWICGFMVEKIWEKVSLYINFENFLDTRQTRFDTIYTGTITRPQFRDIYAPVDGFVANGGVKLRL